MLFMEEGYPVLGKPMKQRTEIPAEIILPVIPDAVRHEISVSDSEFNPAQRPTVGSRQALDRLVIGLPSEPDVKPGR